MQKWACRGTLEKAVELSIGKRFSLRKQIGVLNMEVMEQEAEVRKINSNQNHNLENITALEHRSKQAAMQVHCLPGGGGGGEAQDSSGSYQEKQS